MAKSSKLSKKLVKLLHKFNRYNKREKWFVMYLVVLLFCLLFFPIIKVTSLRGTGGYGVRLVSGVYFKTMMIILVSMLILLGWNLSFKFKNILLSYFGGRDNDSLINFLFLFIITTSFFSMTDTINVASGVTSRVVVSGGGKFIQLLLLIGIILTLVSVIKSAKESGKKTKIINMVDDEHQKDSSKEDIKKGLFE
ncbi:MAG TPA: hypothetical protein VJ892_04440 [Candidatus Absconditabacterales bacterium]|nr:hypothetical protein [Candidatus Absconditabacterales bacterium]